MTYKEFHAKTSSFKFYPFVSFKFFELSEFFAGCDADEVYKAVNSRDVLRNLFALMDFLVSLRVRLCQITHEDVPIFINSAYRDYEHNKRVGGVSTSLHMRGRAADIRSPRMLELRKLLEEEFLMSEFIDHGSYIHIAL